MTLVGSQDLIDRLLNTESLRLFLDYDGTLADFAPTPDVIIPDPEVIDILTRLVDHPHIQPAIISGRRLSHIISLVPVPGILLAGTYGIEMRTPVGELIHRLDYAKIRPGLDIIKPKWQALITFYEGFYLEDKDWTLAIHARFASDHEAEMILSKALEIAVEHMERNVFRLLGGDKFLEVSPLLASKGSAVKYIQERWPTEDTLLVYIGDDDKDEEAFEVVTRQSGIAILVSGNERETFAQLRLNDPTAVREWLRGLIS